jgi:hypothetical protein
MLNITIRIGFAQVTLSASWLFITTTVPASIFPNSLYIFATLLTDPLPATPIEILPSHASPLLLLSSGPNESTMQLRTS